jgi:hypothetical protein
MSGGNYRGQRNPENEYEGSRASQISPVSAGATLSEGFSAVLQFEILGRTEV